MKKDLSEFTCTVRTDTSNAVAATSDTLQQTIQVSQDFSYKTFNVALDCINRGSPLLYHINITRQEKKWFMFLDLYTKTQYLYIR